MLILNSSIQFAAGNHQVALVMWAHATVTKEPLSSSPSMMTLEMTS